ncbi:MAG: hypothetical protein EOP09_03770, partial [Proteobacteria bacterium]
PYLGYFTEKRARAYAAELKSETGKDVDVRCVPAYSTLGWFDDPLLSSMLDPGPSGFGELADTILHESFHATLYIPNQSPFNEGAAEFVGEGLAREYLKAQESVHPGRLAAYEKGVARGLEYRAALKKLAGELDQLYQSEISDELKRSKKQALIQQFRTAQGIKREINNASLAQYLTYTRESDSFSELFKKCGSDWRRFLSSLSRIRRESFREPQQETLSPILSQVSCD